MIRKPTSQTGQLLECEIIFDVILYSVMYRLCKITSKLCYYLYCFSSSGMYSASSSDTEDTDSSAPKRHSKTKSAGAKFGRAHSVLGNVRIGVLGAR
jgi:hypothetical protein